MIKKILIYKDLIVTTGVALLCLTLYGLFPTEGIFQQIISSMTFLLVIPLLYIKIILKRPLADYGIRWGDKKRGVLLMLSTVFISVLLFYVLFQYTSLPKYQNLPQVVTENFAFFVLYEILLAGLFTVLYEFFFRGLVMFSFAKIWGYWSIAAQFALLIAFFLITKNYDWSLFLYVIISPFAGIAAYRSRSLLYSFGASLIFVIIADALSIGLAKQ